MTLAVLRASVRSLDMPSGWVLSQVGPIGQEWVVGIVHSLKAWVLEPRCFGPSLSSPLIVGQGP